AQPRVARIGFLWSGSELTAYAADVLRDGLRDAGWVEGQNLVIEERTYGSDPRRIPELAAELVALKPDLLLALLRVRDTFVMSRGLPGLAGEGVVWRCGTDAGRGTGRGRRRAARGLCRRVRRWLRVHHAYALGRCLPAGFVSGR